MRAFSGTEESLVVSYIPGHTLFGDFVGYSVYYGAAISHPLPFTISPNIRMFDVVMLTDLVDAFTNKSAAVTSKALI
jgi:hypothetical protein